MHRLYKIEIAQNILGQELRLYMRDEHGHELGAAVHFPMGSNLETIADALRSLSRTIMTLRDEDQKADPFGNQNALHSP